VPGKDTASSGLTKKNTTNEKRISDE